MFENLLKLSLTNTSEPLFVARAANGVGAIVVCLDKEGAAWMKTKGCKTMTVADLKSPDFDPSKIDPKAILIFTTKALHALAKEGFGMQERLDDAALKASDLAKQIDICIKQRDAAEAERNDFRSEFIRARLSIEALLAEGANLTCELSEARRPWWKRILGLGVLALCLNLAGCNNAGGVRPATGSIVEYAYEGCISFGPLKRHYGYPHDIQLWYYMTTEGKDSPKFKQLCKDARVQYRIGKGAADRVTLHLQHHTKDLTRQQLIEKLKA